MLYYYIYFIIGFIEVINAALKNENEIINTLSNSNDSEVTLNIDSEIYITKEIKINHSIKKLSLTGNSLSSAILNLKYPLYFDSTIQDIEIKNININGNIFFNKNNKRIIINTVNLNGFIDSDFDKNSHNTIEITKLNYQPSKGESVENCINFSGNINISQSNFYGSYSCRNRLFYYNGFEKYTLEVKESSFNGEYECPSLSIENASNANIKTSHFEKCYSPRNIDGGYIKMNKKIVFFFFF